MSDLKEVVIKGGALIPSKTRKNSRKAQNGGSPQMDRIVPQIGQALSNFGINKQTGGNTGAVVNLSSTRVQQQIPDAVPVVSGISPSQPASVGGGIVLSPKRKSRISLKPKKGSHAPSSTSPTTHKVRKIHLGVKGVTARLVRAKKVKKESMTLPISQVRTALEKVGVIKKSSKAPESMLRTMYADLLITKKGL